MQVRVIGLDACRSSVVCCMLDGTRPSEPRQLYHDGTFHRFEANACGIKALLALKPTVAAIEPTGVNYTKLWVTKLLEAGVEVVLVGHKQLRKYRENLDLPDKDDEADSLALACYYLEHQGSDRRFVRFRDPVVAQIRDLVLRLSHLARVQSPIINRARQDLIWQFPETAKIDLKGTLFWGWLAGRRKSDRYDRLYAQTTGLGLRQEVRHAASLLVQIREQEQLLELQMRGLMHDPRFLPYRKVFAQFGFGERVAALILSQIYPLENYLGENGKPEVIFRKGKRSGKPTRRCLSRRRFQKALGVSAEREYSGDSKKWRKAGPALCRGALWQWLFTRIEPKNKRRLKTDTGKYLGDFLDYQKDHCPTKLARSRTMTKAVDMLFRELVKELCPSSDEDVPQ